MPLRHQSHPSLRHSESASGLLGMWFPPRLSGSRMARKTAGGKADSNRSTCLPQDGHGGQKGASEAKHMAELQKEVISFYSFPCLSVCSELAAMPASRESIGRETMLPLRGRVEGKGRTRRCLESSTEILKQTEVSWLPLCSDAPSRAVTYF